MATTDGSSIDIGDEVEWDWGSDEPAFLIEQEDGDEVLESASELSGAA